MIHRRRTLALIAIVALLSACVKDRPPAASATATSVPATIEVAVNPYPTRVYWGDTHLHTANSGDAIMHGTRLSSEDALRFARGEQVRSSTGVDAQLDRPLDFLVIADHAELIGTGREILAGNPLLMTDPTLRRWNAEMRGAPEERLRATRELIAAYAQGRLPAAITDPVNAARVARSVWDSHIGAVERYNEPGRFTAFLGFEYTSLPSGNNLHRVVMFRDGAERVSQVTPFSALQSQNPEDLWAYLANYERDTGGRALAIPHNGNISNGLMFAFADFEGAAITADYARRRARWEPLTEVTQIKGDGETHPFLSPNDEFADFGRDGWDIGNLDLSAPKTNEMLAGEYARSALLRGLRLEAELGVNPFKFGMIGASDSHTALSSSEESNWVGESPQFEPGPARAGRQINRTDVGARIGWQYLTGGLAGVWATSNTREAIFDAMMRREVYATTGPRMTVRFFGGWDFRAADLRGDIAVAGYRRGVPMGADLPRANGRRGPAFLVSALRDPMGANLDRVQIVKGWLDGDGEMHERIFDVVWSEPGRRRIGRDGRVTPVGDTIDLARATYSNSIGAPQLSTVWRDPEFDPALPAFYYARVIEIPTPRWPVYDAVRFGAQLPDGAQLRTQERAYSSPIWYTPRS